MTPHREAYLAKCSERERFIRDKLETARMYLKWQKQTISNGGIRVVKPNVKHEKAVVMAFRHELARLKGMDRVVVPMEQYNRSLETDDWYCSKCEEGISVFENYCPKCGRRILWKKVKVNGKKKEANNC